MQRVLQVFILLDALDEADPLREQLHASAMAARQALLAEGYHSGIHDSKRPPPLTPAGNSALQLLKDHVLPGLPQSVRLVITTRPDAVGGRVLDALRTVSSNSCEVLTPELLREDPSRAAATAGHSQVMLVRTVCREVLGEDDDAGRPDTLGALYRAFHRSFEKAHDNDPSQWAEVKSLVDVLAAAQEPLSLALLQQMGLSEIRKALPGWNTLYSESEHRM